MLISFFGVFGILFRFGIDSLFSEWNEQFPFSTLLINLLGSFIAGAVYVMSDGRWIPENLQLALMVGFCGGFTTFSAYTLQTFTMLEQGKVGPALIYVVISPVLGLLLSFVAILVMRRLFV